MEPNELPEETAVREVFEETEALTLNEKETKDIGWFSEAEVATLDTFDLTRVWLKRFFLKKCQS